MCLAEDDSDIGKESGYIADGYASQHHHAQVSSINTTRRFQSRQTYIISPTMHISYRPTVSLVSTCQSVSVILHWKLGSDQHGNQLQV